MKKLVCFLFLCILLGGCSAPEISELPGELVTVDGTCKLSREDFHFAQIYEGISLTNKQENEELFRRLAAEAVCVEIAERWEESEDYTEIAAEYEIYLESLDDTGQRTDHEALRKELSELTDEEFRETFISYLYRSASVESFMKSIASEYGNISDAGTIREGILANLWELSDDLEIALHYPGMEDDEVHFEDLE